MAAHRKSRKLLLLPVALCVLAAAAFGGYVLTGRITGNSPKLSSASDASRSGARLGAAASSSPPPGSAPASARPGPARAKAPPAGPRKMTSTITGSKSGAPGGGPAGTTTSWAWCTSAALGQSANFAGRYDLYNNEWNSNAGPGPQTICGNSQSHWQVTSTQRSGNTEVLTYPSVQVNYNSTNGYPVSRFTTMTSSYSESMHAVGGTDAEAAYDIWINGLNKEVMVWVDDHGQAPSGSRVATTSFSGSTWDLYETSDKSYLAFVRRGNASSGTVDLHAALAYLEGRGDLSGSDVLWQVNFGWEVCSTAGAPETFTMNSYSLDSAPSS